MLYFSARSRIGMKSRWKEERVVMDALQQCVPMLGVDLFELAEVAPLLAEGLDGGHAGDILLEVRVHPGQDLSALAVVVPRPLAIGGCPAEHERKRDERD